ncbi:MAG: type III-B CRISPR module-associated Cmr3 family protein, partial [Elainella sp.]
MSDLPNDLHWYSLDPLDVLLLREAKPFSPADGSWAKGQFPPMPITVFQALRSALPEQSGPERNLSFLGPFLLQETPEGPILWLPTPKDLLAVFVQPESLDQPPDEQPEQFAKEASPGWQSTDRLCPLDADYPGHEFLGFNPEQFSASDLTPMVAPARNCGYYGRVFSWMRAEALARYLSGNWQNLQESDFHAGEPWSLQVLPHIQIEPGTRQVKSEDGYFTEVAVRLHQNWKLAVGFSELLDTTVVRLGGEGHRVLVSPLATLPGWDELTKYRTPQVPTDTAYLLTPGLAEADRPNLYAVYPSTWKPHLRGCASDRPILAGGMSKFQKSTEHPRDVAFTPQRAFVSPGTVYRFKPQDDSQDSLSATQLLPPGEENWLKTLKS